MFDTRRSRARRAATPPPAQTPPPMARGARSVSFNVPLNGSGDVVVLEYTPVESEYARIDFACRIPGTLRIRVGGRVVLNAKTFAGRALVQGLFFPEGERVSATFTNDWGGGEVRGTINIGPAPVTEAVAAARALFGLGAQYTAEELSRAHKRLVLRWHPDRPGGDHAKMSEANHCFDLLKARLP